MNFDVIGLHPDNALKIALNIFDGKDSVDHKIRALLNNRPIKQLNSVDLPPNFKSGKTIDLNLSELLGIGAVTSYYSWASEQANTPNTYQAVVGIEDSAKQLTENFLSDGAVWHDQRHEKMVAQQVMVQGYFPEKSISDDDVVEAIRKKMLRRGSYPENCMLIVNIFGDIAAINRDKIYSGIKNLNKKYTDVYVVVYSLPLLTLANVSYMSEPKAAGLTILLKRHKYVDEWKIKPYERRQGRDR